MFSAPPVSLLPHPTALLYTIKLSARGYKSCKASKSEIQKEEILKLNNNNF
jgi:hypothetical protein